MHAGPCCMMGPGPGSGKGELLRTSTSTSIYHSRIPMIVSRARDTIHHPPHRRFRGIEWNGVKFYDLQKVTFSTLFKLYIAGLGVLIKKRYHILG